MHHREIQPTASVAIEQKQQPAGRHLVKSTGDRVNMSMAQNDPINKTDK